MPGYYFIYLTVLLGLCFLLVRYFVLRRKSQAMLLFLDAIKAENNGNYQQAVDAYEGALFEVKKTRFDRYLKMKIVEKLKLLQTIKTYQSEQAFVRKDDSWIN